MAPPPPRLVLLLQLLTVDSAGDPPEVVLNCAKLEIMDLSGLEALNKAAKRYRESVCAFVVAVRAATRL